MTSIPGKIGRGDIFGAFLPGLLLSSSVFIAIFAISGEKLFGLKKSAGESGTIFRWVYYNIHHLTLAEGIFYGLFIALFTLIIGYCIDALAEIFIERGLVDRLFGLPNKAILSPQTNGAPAIIDKRRPDEDFELKSAALFSTLYLMFLPYTRFDLARGPKSVKVHFGSYEQIFQNQFSYWASNIFFFSAAFFFALILVRRSMWAFDKHQYYRQVIDRFINPFYARKSRYYYLSALLVWPSVLFDLLVGMVQSLTRVGPANAVGLGQEMRHRVAQNIKLIIKSETDSVSSGSDIYWIAHFIAMENAPHMRDEIQRNNIGAAFSRNMALSLILASILFASAIRKNPGEFPSSTDLRLFSAIFLLLGMVFLVRYQTLYFHNTKKLLRLFATLDLTHRHNPVHVHVEAGH